MHTSIINRSLFTVDFSAPALDIRKPKSSLVKVHKFKPEDNTQLKGPNHRKRLSTPFLRATMKSFN